MSKAWISLLPRTCSPRSLLRIPQWWWLLPLPAEVELSRLENGFFFLVAMGAQWTVRISQVGPRLAHYVAALLPSVSTGDLRDQWLSATLSQAIGEYCNSLSHHTYMCIPSIIFKALCIYALVSVPDFYHYDKIHEVFSFKHIKEKRKLTR